MTASSVRRSLAAGSASKDSYTGRFRPERSVGNNSLSPDCDVGCTTPAAEASAAEASVAAVPSAAEASVAAVVPTVLATSRFRSERVLAGGSGSNCTGRTALMHSTVLIVRTEAMAVNAVTAASRVGPSILQHS